jgi:hypothetical protein
VGLFKSLLGRGKGPALSKVDALFALPTAAITLEVSMEMRATGLGAIAFRAPEGAAFTRVQQQIQQLLDVDGPPVQISQDRYGYTWFLCAVNHHDDRADVGTLVTEMNAIVASLQDEGWGPQMLCALVHFRDAQEKRLSLVYLFKQGSFYPFAPMPGAQESNPVRDNVFEFSVRDLLVRELPMEKDLQRWHPLWDAPGL